MIVIRKFIKREAYYLTDVERKKAKIKNSRSYFPADDEGFISERMRCLIYCTIPSGREASHSRRAISSELFRLKVTFFSIRFSRWYCLT